MNNCFMARRYPTQMECKLWRLRADHI